MARVHGGGGYRRPEFWLSDGWAVVNAEHWEAPLYWFRDPERTDRWLQFTLAGVHPVDPDEPVCHVSYYEADAFAHWTGLRLPTEGEWETVAVSSGEGNNFLSSAPAHPRPALSDNAMFGDVWEWTSSAYSPYPGFRAAPGAVGEYNGKFMVSQYVLRGGVLRHATWARAADLSQFLPARRPLGVQRRPTRPGPLNHGLLHRCAPLSRGGEAPDAGRCDQGSAG